MSEADCFAGASSTVPKGHYASVRLEGRRRSSAMNKARISTKPNKMSKAGRKRMRR